MSIVKRFNKLLGLEKIDVLVDDRDTSRHIIISDMPESLPQGKSSFLIEVSPYMRRGIELQIDFIDSKGNSIYVEPVSNYLEGTSRTVSVEVYNTVAPGVATMIIVGELEGLPLEAGNYSEVQEIPDEFKGVYNVRLTKEVIINSAEVNVQPIKFYSSPKLTAVEKRFGTMEREVVSGEITSSAFSVLGKPVIQQPYSIFNSQEEESEALGTGVTETNDNQQPDPPDGDVKGDDADKEKQKQHVKKRSVRGNSRFRRSRRIRRRNSPIEYPYLFTIDDSNHSFTTKEIGGEIKFSNIDVSIYDSDALDDNDLNSNVTFNVVTDTNDENFPTHYTASIAQLENDKAAYVNTPFTKQDDEGNYRLLEMKATGKVHYTPEPSASYSITNIVSYADVTLSHLRTFSGEVFKAKVYVRAEGSFDDYKLLAEVPVESPELMVNANSVGIGERTGYFVSEADKNTYWDLFGGTNGLSTATSTSTASYDNSTMLDSVMVSGSTSTFTNQIRFELKDAYNFSLTKGIDYDLSFKAIGQKDTDGRALLMVYVSGSSMKQSSDLHYDDSSETEVSEPSQYGKRMGVLEVTEDIKKDFGLVRHNFNCNLTGDAKVQFRVIAGQWNLSDISVVPSTDTGFSPSFVNFTQELPPELTHKRPETLEFLTEFYDINNNLADEVAVTTGSTFTGGNMVITGDDNVLEHNLFIGGDTTGSGIHMGGTSSTLPDDDYSDGATGSGFIRSIGYLGFQSASNSALGGKKGFMIYSGSVLPNSGEDYNGVGLELVGASGSLKFRTNPSVFDVQADSFFVGKSTTQFVSGSNEQIEISSSNFHLTPEGNVTMSGTITAAAGTIGGFTIEETKLTTTGIELAAATEDLFISSSAFKVDHDGNITASNIDLGGTISATSGDVGGWIINAGSLTAGAGSSAVTMSSADKVIAMGSGSTFNKGDLEGGFRVGIDTDGQFKFAVGSSDSYIHADGTGVSIKSDSFDVTASVAEIDVDIFKLSANNLFISSSGGGFISAGNPRPTGITGTNKGFYVQGDTGVFLAGNAAGGHIKFDGTNTSISSSAFFLGSPTQFISGSLGNIEISSSNFHLDNAGNVVMSGNVSATTGTIGGLTIGTTKLSSGTSYEISSSTNVNDPVSFISSSNFKVSAGGQVTASALKLSSGDVGGLSVAEGEISVGSILKFKDSGQITGSSVLFTGGTIGGFTIDADEIKSTNVLIDSANEKITLGSSNAIKLQGGGTDNFIAMGSKSTFSNEGTGTAGIIIGMDATNPQAEFVKDANNYFIFDDGIDIRTDTLKASGSNIILEAPRFFLGGVDQFVSGSNGNVEVSSSDFHLTADGTVTASAILLGNKTSGNFLQFVGSTLSVRGDITADTIAVPSAATTPSSSITADGLLTTVSASIGGFDITSTEIKDSSSNLILKSNGQITASAVSMSGNINASAGDIGGFVIGSTQINSTNDNLILKSNGQITASAVSMSGTVTADAGQIAGWSISGNLLQNSNGTLRLNGRATTPKITIGTHTVGNGPGVQLGYDSGGTLTFFAGQSATDFIKYTAGTGIDIQTDSLKASGSNIILEAPRFFLGGATQFVSGSNGNVEISSSNFHLTPEGNVTMSGDITAAGGTIGGFTIGDDLSNSAGSTLKLKGSSGQITASAAQITGKITAEDGTIGGFNIGTDLTSTAGTLTLKGASGQITASAVSMSGTVTATAGNIAGFQISGTKLQQGTSFHLDGDSSATYFISSSNFAVTPTGNLSASNALFDGTINVTGTGTIAGWTIASNRFADSGDNIRLDSNTSAISIKNHSYGQSGIQLQYNSGTTRFYVGNGASKFIQFNGTNVDIGTENLTASGSSVSIETPSFFFGKLNTNYISGSNNLIEISSSKFHLQNDGDVIMNDITASNANVSGKITATTGEVGGWDIGATTLSSNNLILNSSGLIETSDYVTNEKGWRITSANSGEAEFQNIKIRGTLSTAVFEKESVNAVGGQLYIANSTAITGSATVAATATTMSVSNVGGFVANEVLSAKKVSATGFATEYMLVESSSRDFPSSETDFRGKLYLIRGYRSGSLGASGSLGDVANISQSFEPGQVIVSTGKIGTGFIRLNANPNDSTTPYIDIVERTGSGVYDVDLKARLGDLSGLSSGLLYGNASPGFGLFTENVFLQGAITATTGSFTGKVHVGTTDGIVIDGNAKKLYQGTGTHNNTNTGFYMDSSGNFSLGDKLVWNGSSLTVTGAINITSGTGFATAESVSGSFATPAGVSGSAQQYGAGAAASASAVQGNLDTVSGSIATDLNTVSSSTAARIVTDANNLIIVPADAPSGNGLFLTSNYLGYYNNGWNAFIQSNGNFLFKADDNNLVSFGVSQAGGNFASSSNFVLRASNAFLSGSSVNVLTERFFLGGSSQFISGSNSNIEISSSNFHLTPTGDVTMAGKVTSAEGTIGGFAITPTAISSSNGSLVLNADGGITGSKFRLTGGTITSDVTILGDLSANSIATPASADPIKAQITSEGFAKFISASIGGFEVSTNQINSANDNLILKDSGQITASAVSMSGTIVADSGNIGGFIIDSSEIRDSNSLLQLKANGQITASAAKISGDITISSGDLAGVTAATISGSNDAVSSSLASDTTGLLQGSSSMATKVVLSGTDVRVKYDDNNYAKMDADSFDVILGGQTSASFGANTTVGPTGGSHVLVNSEQIAVKRGGVTFLSASADGLEMSGSINASGGTIGGFTIDTNKIESATGGETINYTVTANGSSNYLIDGVAQPALTFEVGNTYVFSMTSGVMSSHPFRIGTSANGSAITDGVTITSTTLTIVVTSSTPTSLYYWCQYHSGMGNSISVTTATPSLILNGSNGQITASAVSMSGMINASSGQIGNFGIRSNNLQGGTTFQLNPTNNSGEIRMGSSFGPNSADSTTTGIYMSGQGEFGFVQDTNNRIYYDGALRIKSSGEVDISGSSVDISTPKFYLGESSQFISGSNGNIEVSSSNFHLDNAGNVVMSGKITADEGSIGGLTIGSDKIYVGTGNHNNSDTAFYVEDDGKFSLKDKLVWDGSTLTVTGAINITSGTGFATAASVSGSFDTAGTAAALSTGAVASASAIGVGATASASNAQDAAQTYASAVGAGATTSASNAQDAGVGAAAGAQASASLYASSSAVSASGFANTVQSNLDSVSGSIATDISASNSTQTTVSASTAARIVTDANSKIIVPNSTPSGNGLFLTSEFLGYYNSGWNAFIQNNGNFLFKADNDNLVSFGTTVNGGDGQSTTNFVLKAQNAFLSGSSVNVLTERFFLGGSGQFVSGSNSKLEISSSNFHLQRDGDVIVSGDITITGGDLAGIDASTISGSQNATSASLAAASQSMATQVKLSSDGMTLNQADGTTLATYGSTTLIGPTATEHVKISSAGLQLKDGNTTRMSMSAAGIEMGDNFSVDASGNVSVAGSITITGGNAATTTYAQGVAAGAEASASLYGAGAVSSGSAYASASANEVQDNLNTVSGSTASSIAQTLVDSGSIAAAIELTSEGLNILNNVPAAIAQYGADATIGRTTGTFSNVFIDSSEGEVQIRKGTVVSASFGATTTIGPTGGSHVLINSEQIAVKRGTTTFLSASAAGLDMSGSIKATGGTIGGNTLTSGSIFSGTGTFGNSNTPFFLDSGGRFSLKDKLSFNGSTLSVNGSVTATAGTIGGWQVTGDTLVSINEDSIVLDGDNERISINSTTFGNTGIQLQYNSGTPRFFAGNSGNHVKFDGSKLIVASDNFDIDATGNVSMSGHVTAAGGQIATFSISSGSIDSDTSNSKRGLKLEPGDSIRGYGNTVHSTTTVQGKFSFGVATVAPPADAPESQQFSTDYTSAQAPGGGYNTE